MAIQDNPGTEINSDPICAEIHWRAPLGFFMTVGPLARLSNLLSLNWLESRTIDSAPNYLITAN